VTNLFSIAGHLSVTAE